MAMMLSAFIDKGVTAENVAAFAQLCALKERVETRDAEKAFNSAFAQLQSELPTIVAESEIPKRGKYARFEEVMRQIQPMLTSNGFSVSFEQKADDTRVSVTCHLRHIGGHASINTFSVRMGNNADSATQADCKASTTAKRNALLQALNIVVRQDIFQDEDDPHNESHERVTQQQADELRELCDETRADRAKFLALDGAEDFEMIHSHRFDEMKGFLIRRRK